MVWYFRRCSDLLPLIPSLPGTQPDRSSKAEPLPPQFPELAALHRSDPVQRRLELQRQGFHRIGLVVKLR